MFIFLHFLLHFYLLNVFHLKQSISESAI